MGKKSRLLVLGACAFFMGVGFSVTAFAQEDPEGECLLYCWQQYRMCKSSGYFTPQQCDDSYHTCRVRCYN